MEMPPLPEPFMRSQYKSIPPRPPLALYIEEQMRSYGESCARMAREEEREACVTVIIEVLRATGLPNIEALAAAIRKG